MRAKPEAKNAPLPQKPGFGSSAPIRAGALGATWQITPGRLPKIRARLLAFFVMLPN
jgi:hypothetical protein